MRPTLHRALVRINVYADLKPFSLHDTVKPGNMIVVLGSETSKWERFDYNGPARRVLVPDFGMGWMHDEDVILRTEVL